MGEAFIIQRKSSGKNMLMGSVTNANLSGDIITVGDLEFEPRIVLIYAQQTPTKSFSGFFVKNKGAKKVAVSGNSFITSGTGLTNIQSGIYHIFR